LSNADQKLKEAGERRNEKLKSNQEWFSRKRGDQRTDAREDYEENEDKINDDYDETKARWRGYKEGLGKGLGELNSNKDISFAEIERYAGNLASDEEQKQRAMNEGSRFRQKQQRKITDLKQRGYEPQVIEKSFKGKPTAVEIGFYNPETKDWVSGTEFKIKAPVDVLGLKKLGYSAPQQRQIQFGGKTYEFQSRIGVFKAPSGEIVTPYERTGITEEQLIKQQQDVAFKEWEAKPKPVYVPFKPIDKKDLPVGYGGQQTISEQPSDIIMSEQDYYRDIKKFDFGVGKVWGKAGAGFDWVKQRVHWDFSISTSPIAPVNIFKFGKLDEPTIVEKAYADAFKDVEKGSQKLEEWVVGKGKIEKFKLGIEEKYQTEYQTKFERKYMEDLIRGTFQQKIDIPSGKGAGTLQIARDVGGGMIQDVLIKYKDGEIIEKIFIDEPIPITKRFKDVYGESQFERASKEFEESKEAKLLQKKFAQEYGEGYRELQTGKGFWKGTVAGGLGQTGLSLSKLLLKATGDPASAVLTVGAVGGGVKVLKAIPPIISTGLTVGLGVYGGVKLFDPSSTYIEKGGGLLTLTIAGVSLGYGAYRYLKSPVVKTIKIKPPKRTLKVSEVIGKDIKIQTDKGMVNKVLFENQKLSQTATAGRRTLVTTKGRELIIKYTKLKPAPIYRGVPIQELGTVKYYERFGGLVKIGKRSAYQKAFIKLTDYGWTPSQAKATLRYVAPKITEQYLRRGVLTIKGAKAVGEFEFLTKRPILDVDKTLGIKTRGAKTIKDIYNVERKIISIKRGEKISRLVLEQKTCVGFSLKDEKLFKFTKADFSRGLGISKATKELKGYEYLGKDISGLDVFKEARYKDIYSISATKKIFPADKIIVDASKTKLINKILDLRKKDYIYVKPTGIKKTPFPVTDDIIRKIKPSPSSDIAKIMNKLDDIGAKGSATNLQLKRQLKTAISPNLLKTIKLKDIIKIKQLGTLAKIDVAQLTAITGIKTGIKSDIKLKTELKARTDLKILLKEDVGLKVKTAQLPALKTSPALKSQLKAILNLPSISSLLKTDLIIKTPTIPKITPPTKTPFALPFLEGEILKMARRTGAKSVYDRAYLPDFTARALGLKAETITEKQARKKLKKLLTGLEIRRSVKVKW